MFRLQRGASALSRIFSPITSSSKDISSISRLSKKQTKPSSSGFYPLRRHAFSTSSKSFTSTSSFPELQTKQDAEKFLGNLSDDQKTILYHSLHVEVLRDKYMSELASESHYLSRFGRPAATTGDDHHPPQFCEVPPNSLQSRKDLKGTFVPLTGRAYGLVGLKNALPFVGFGFLDNLIMILAGDYIDLTIGVTLGISTMAAAALGNTVSDVAGIASAWYVESFAEKIGIREPALTPAQLASKGVRWVANLGRALGVVIGCLLGMLPLWFLPSPEQKKERESTLKK